MGAGVGQWGGWLGRNGVGSPLYMFQSLRSEGKMA